MDKETVVHPGNGILFRAKKKWLSSQEKTWRNLKFISPTEKVSLKRLRTV